MHLSLGRMFPWGICHKEQNARELGRKLPPSKVEIAGIYCSEKKKLNLGLSEVDRNVASTLVSHLEPLEKYPVRLETN